MTFIKDILLIALGFIVTLTSGKPVSERAQDLRVTAYIAGDQLSRSMKLDPSHFTDVTDVILIGVCNFNTAGEVVPAPYFEDVLALVKDGMSGSGARLHLNLIGPGYVTSSTDWNEQMDDQSDRHEQAFSSGVLEKNIKDVLDKYGFDGVFFDYEYPLTQEHWDKFDAFLLSLDAYLGDGYVLGAAISGWNTMQSKKAIAVLDMVEVMAYDIWDGDGNHAPMAETKSCIRQMLLRGYKREQLDLGIPFYARPTTHDAYWYAYSGYCEDIDENGLCTDPATGLVFSFNTPETVAEKTKWAINKGLGGVMVWHYACDVPQDNELSLFNAITRTKAETAANPYAVRSAVC